MARVIYLAVFTNRTKPANWSIWIPTRGQGSKGKMINVTGNPATGFYLQFKRNYDFDFTKTKHQIIELGQIHDQYVTDLDPALPSTVDTTARDRLESVATTVPPPPKSANPFDTAAPNCQNWIFDFIEKLIADSVIDSSVRTILQNAPRVI
ncbi:hypothetical protein K458DRAFT_413135 [Lentithecium fluviatile CBS 122367]|uniref:Uncharacterized protein n=1 Tax=Lentithecium fluviatile CBS 122367 TaxID=1168545 RepID=A0A6G1JJJ9_9PLEO|nr:hypothetical protein K458DRAFT_413135 [Lentithecium fluviatile CBS 122367]